MVLLKKYWVLLALVLVQSALAIDQSGWNNKERAVWSAAQRHLDTAYLMMDRRFRSPYVFNAPVSREEIEDAWVYAGRDHAGPIYKGYHVDSRKSVYVLTKLPSSHQLVDKWGLNEDGIDKDAFLFWKVKKDGGRIAHKLLGVEVMASGAVTGQRYRLHDILSEAHSL
ncbi:uncharacterized protein UMAG_05930 [Mycosarcoma maydis]|uniref:Uncharacterized protein n=1 Tax=Mycosarcoma maydis TaxID=5270 RepID=A0A0D1DP21_MYCMD|nr:uncharacterized protein UMAG_05930 [Ustilago maydis 521]KIS66194.1 hypothetical protein UMAG_05930 [Ustilago maydis 521]|eukprot:XP_011392266.1 hypothetical protein UMAG_05930 [Ustilago maydis 521]